MEICMVLFHTGRQATYSLVSDRQASKGRPKADNAASYKKVLIVLKEINHIPFIHNYWKVFWKNHPAKKEKSEHKKWRLLRNSASVMLSVKSKFNLEQK